MNFNIIKTIIPKQELNESRVMSIVPRIDWSPAAIEMFKNVVESADKLIFQTKYVDEGRCFGQLYVMVKEHRENVTQMLIDSNESIGIDDYLYGMADNFPILY